MELTNATKARVRELGWGDELIARVEASALREPTVANMAMMNIAPDRAERFVTLAENDPERIPNLTFKFMPSFGYSATVSWVIVLVVAILSFLQFLVARDRRPAA